MALSSEFSNEELLILAVRDLTAAIIEGCAQITASIDFSAKAYPRHPDQIAEDIISGVSAGAYQDSTPE